MKCRTKVSVENARDAHYMCSPVFILSLAIAQGNHLRRQISSYTSNPSWVLNVRGGCACVVKLNSSANEANNEMFPQSKDPTDMSFR